MEKTPTFTVTSSTPLAPTEVPFHHSVQLCDTFPCINQDDKNDSKDTTTTTSTTTAGVCDTRLPGQPWISLAASASVITAYLRKEHLTPRLNKMAAYLWLVGKQSSAHVSSLHAQAVRGRNIVIAEDPDLHLVWIGNRIFIKPLPRYLLSYGFWARYLCCGERGPRTSRFQSPLTVLGDDGEDEDDAALTLRQSVLGYMRTYYLLIRHESDFRIAQTSHLIPDDADIDFPRFVAFMAGFARVTDQDVTPRYHYGQLRLTRLNFWAPFALREWQFQKIAWQYADILARFYGPVLFVFGVLTVILASMQVGLAARPTWAVFAGVSAWFSVLSLVTVLAMLVPLMGLVVWLWVREAVFAVKAKMK